jgi:hypothetical protein
VHRPQTGPPTPTTQRCTAITCDGFGLFPVRSPLLGESRLFSSPPGTEMVQFPGSSFRNLCIQSRMMAIQAIGLPHSAIRGSRDVCSSPRLFAAYHGLLRTAAPRHPPWTLSRLTILSSALQSRLSTLARFNPPGTPPEPVPQTPRPIPLNSSHSEPRSTPHQRPRASLLAHPRRLSGQQLPGALLFTLPLHCQRTVMGRHSICMTALSTAAAARCADGPVGGPG